MEDKSRQETQAAAEYLGGKAFGIVHTRRGWAIRVASDDYPTLVHQVNPEQAAKLTAQYFEVSGFPNSFSKSAVRASLAEWHGVEPVRPVDRVINGYQGWIVRAPSSHTRERVQASF